MQAEILLRALEELFADVEFGRRARIGGRSETARRVVTYFVDRGIDPIDARLLAQAYNAGAHHELHELAHALDRAEERS